MITVTLAAAADLKDAMSTTIKLVPATAGGIALAAVSIGFDDRRHLPLRPWAAPEHPIPTKYLPGSCKAP